MLNVIVIIVIIVIIWKIIQFVRELLGTISNLVGNTTVIVVGVLCFLAYFTFSWIGVFIVALLGICTPLLIGQMKQAGGFIKDTVEEHDKKMQQIQQDRKIQENEKSLQNELDKNCRWLGCMSAEEWEKKLPNYVSKTYTKSFYEITMNFAEQLEEQNIKQNNDWFTPFLKYIVSTGGVSIRQMLHEVKCPQLQMTHVTPDEELLTRILEECHDKKYVKEGVPALVEPKMIKEDLIVYQPTPYACKLYGDKSSNTSTKFHQEKLSFDDLI